MPSAEERREELKAVFRQASVCERCPQLASTRQTVVFGSGNANADLMFVGEAPGANEDKQGVPFVGQAGKLLDQLLGEIGLHAPGRLRRQCPQMPASRQPRSAAAGDRQLPGLPVPPARADRAEGRLHARQLLDEAAARRPGDRHHAAPRPRGGPRHRPARRAAVPDLPPGRRALHALAARHAARRLRPPAGPARARPAAAARAGSPRSPSRSRSSRSRSWSRRSRRTSRPSLSSACSSPGRRLRALVDRQRVALVVAPLAADQQVARRVALEAEAGAAGERDRGGVAGLDVRLDAVERERAERVVEDVLEPAPHQALVGVAGASRSSRGTRTGTSRGRSGRC